jgi:S-adenosylmethionine:tRNA ribosyltransferase-isomerase
MDVSLFDYLLPKDLIAQFPTRRREESRLMVLDRSVSTVTHRRFSDVVEFLRPGDALVVNNTKVFKARLYGRRKTGGVVEVFLVRRATEHEGEVWLALARPSRRLRPGESVLFDNDRHLTLLCDVGDGQWLVEFTSRSARERIVARHGHVPLPQYIQREDQPSDIRRYQTLFADPDKVGAWAAPTAGFHFSAPILKAIEAIGVSIHEITLHVGPGHSSRFRSIT